MSQLFNLHLKDFLHGAIIAVFSAVITTLQSLIANKGFNLTKQDGLFIAGVAVTACLSYLGKKFVTDEDGKIAGKI